MIVPFWSWNLSDTTHVRPHTKFQLVWAINTVFTRGGHMCPPPSLKCVAGTPSLLELNLREPSYNLRLKLYLQPPGGAPVPRPLLQLDLVQDSHLALKQHRFAGTVSVVL